MCEKRRERERGEGRGGGERGGGGGGGADVVLQKRVCPCSCTRVQARALVPLAGLSSRNPNACSLQEQVPGIPDGDLNQPQGEEKG